MVRIGPAGNFYETYEELIEIFGELKDTLAKVPEYCFTQKIDLEQLTIEEKFNMLQSTILLTNQILDDWFFAIVKYEWAVEFKKYGWEIVDKDRHKKKQSGLDIHDLNALIGRSSVGIDNILKKIENTFLNSVRLQKIIEEINFEDYKYLKKSENRIKEYFKKELKKNPKCLKDIFALLHTSDEKIYYDTIYWLLGIKEDRDIITNIRTLEEKLEKKYGPQNICLGTTPYDAIRDFIRNINLKPNDIVYDLGSGDGQVVFYGALATDTKYKGIEIVPQRVKECKRIKNKYNIDNAEFIQGNVIDQDYSDGSIFFLFNPFCQETLDRVIDTLHDIAKIKKIKIVNYYGFNDFGSQDWLQCIYNGIINNITIFESKLNV